MIGRRFAFTVPFVAGKQRHRLDRRHARMYTPNETIRNEAAIRDAALGAEVHVVKWPRRRGIEPHMDIQVYRGWADPAEEKK